MSTPQPSHKRARACRNEKERRIILAENLIIRGFSTNQITQVLIQKEGISERQAFRYVKEANARIHCLGNAPAEAQMALLNRRTEFLYQQALQKDDSALALKLLKTQMQLLIAKQNQKEPLPNEHTPSATPGCSLELEAALRLFETPQTSEPSSGAG